MLSALQECIAERIVEQIVEGLVPQILEEIVELVSLTSATADRRVIVDVFSTDYIGTESAAHSGADYRISRATG